MNFVGTAFRRQLQNKSQRFPWHYYLRLVYNDAMTQGGVNASWRFSEIARSPQNRAMQGLVN